MAWTKTQGSGSTQVAISANGTTTLSITPTGTTGKLLVATIAFAATSTGSDSAITVSSVSDSVDGAWTVVKVSSAGPGGSGAVPTVSAIAYRDAPSSTAARTITLTNGTIAASCTWQLSEFDHTGIIFATDGNANVGSGSTTASTTVTVSGPTPSVAGDLAIAVGVNDSGSAWTAPTGGIWNVLWSLTASGSGTDGRAVYGVGPTSGSAMSTTFTETSASGVCPTALVVCFKGAAVVAEEPSLSIRPPGTRLGTPLHIFRGRYSDSPAVTDLSLALTGQAATFAAGSLGVNVSVVATGQAATFAVGTASPSTTVAITGRAATFAAGTLTYGSAIGLTGQGATFAGGSLGIGSAASVGGQAANFATGTLGVQFTLALTGQSATFSAGTIVATTGVVVALTGQAATFAGGTLIPQSSIAVNGQSASFAPGTLTPSSTIAMGGQAASFAAGTASPASSIGMTGQLAAFAAGGLGIQVALAMVGQPATFAQGTVTPQQGGDLTLALTGLVATFSAGQIGVTGADSAVTTTAEIPAGRRRLRYRVTIDGVPFICRTLEEARALLTQAKETARKRAEDAAMWALAAQQTTIEPVPIPVLKTPTIEVSSRELRAAASETRRSIAQIYEAELKVAELRMLLEIADRAQEEEDIISLFFL